MKRHYLLTAFLSVLFFIITFHTGTAFASISGDDVCGGSTSNCGLAAFKIVYQNIFGLVISIGLPLLTVAVIYRFVVAWYAALQGNTNAYKEATKKVTNAIVGFILIVLVAGGILFAMIKTLGVNSKMMQLLQKISSVEIERAYAGSSVCKKANDGDQCFMPNVGPSGLYGVIVVSGQTSDVSCSDSVTGKTYTYQDGLVSDCTGVKNGTPCDTGSYYSRMGICFTPNDTTASASTGASSDPLSFITDKVAANAAGYCGNYKEGSPCSSGGKTGICVNNNQKAFCTNFRTAFFATSAATPVAVGKCAALGHTGDICYTNQNELGMCITTGACVKILSKPEALPVSNSGTPSNSGVPGTGSAPATQLPNPLGFDSLYDFILGVLNMILKFFLYPAMVGVWVLTGFMYVAAQGAPEKLTKAHKLLLWAFISTFITFSAQAFLMAVKGSVDKLIPTTNTSVTTGTQNAAPAAGTTSGTPDVNAACSENGVIGTINEDGVCVAQ